MEEERRATKFCSNCKKDIPENVFDMHESHCHRNIILCDLCQEPIPKSQNEEHFDEYHAKVKCECGESMEKMHLDEHKEKECQSRKTTCQYCNLECTVGKIDSHKEYCGSRTEICENCNNRIQHRDLEEHLQSNCTMNNNESTANNNASSSLQNGFSRNPPEEMVRNFGFRDVDVALAGGQEVFHRLLTSGFGTLPVGGMFEQEQFYDNRNMFSTNRAPRDDVVARGPSNNRGQRGPGRERSRHLVDNQVRNDGDVDLESDELVAALLACEDDGGFTGGTHAGFKDPLPGINQLHGDHNIHIKHDEGTDLNETNLPCEFCGALIKAQDLIQHQTACQLTSNGSPSLYPHLRSQPRSLPPLDPDLYSDDDQVEHNGDIDHHDETFLPCEFCQELFPSDSLIGHQSICDPEGSRPPSAIHTYQAAFFESDQQSLNNSPYQTKVRPSRPSRPVVVSDSSEEQDMNLFHPTSDLRSTRRVTSNDEGSGVSFNPAGHGELRSLRVTYSNSDTVGGTTTNSTSSSNNDIVRSSNDIGRSSNNIGRNSNNISSSRRLASGNSRSQRNNEAHSRLHGSASNSVPLTYHNEQVSQGAMRTQGSRKTTSQHLSRPARVTSDDKKDEFVVALPKRSSPKIPSGSRYGERFNGLQESEKNSRKNDDGMSAFSVNGRYRNGTRSEETGNELPWEMRPLQETGATRSATASQRPTRKGLSSGGHQFQHSAETRKQMARLAPSIDKPPRSTESRKEGSKSHGRPARKAAVSGRHEQRAGSERGAQGSTTGRPSSSTKPKTKKKIV